MKAFPSGGWNGQYTKEKERIKQSDQRRTGFDANSEGILSS
jgi:hypothetical protein